MNIIPHKIKQGLSRVPNIKNIIAVTSGKGGVGKSTTAINLAISLAKNGVATGLLDADVYGPSVPILVGERSFKPGVVNARFIPLDKFGIQILSFGFLVAENQPAIWRGAIVNKALDQLLFDTNWRDLDCLIIDMPPGTGDIHISMCQKMPITAVISVTTPQDIALLDVAKSIEMYKKMGIPCLGIIENMSTHICSNCGHIEELFGSGGGDKLALTYGFEILGKLPLDINIRLNSDKGIPIAANADNFIADNFIGDNLIVDNSIAELYSKLSVNVLNKLSLLGKDCSSKLGMGKLKIVN